MIPQPNTTNYDQSGIIPYYGRSNPYPPGRTAESRFQKAVTRLVRLKYKEAIYFHVPNEGKRTNGARLKAEGMKKGVADCLFDNSRQGFPGLRIELKTGDNYPDAEQKQYLKDVISEGYFATVCWNIESVEKILDWYYQK